MATFNERLTAAKELCVTPTLDTTSTGTLNDYATTGISYLKFSGAVTQINGFANGVNGKLLTVINAYTASFLLANLSTGSSNANRILTGNGGDHILQPQQSALLQYDTDSGKWRIFAAQSVAENITGRIDGVTVASGFIGETITSQISTGTNAAAANTLLALTSITLTPGVWNIGAMAGLLRNGATLITTHTWYVCISTTSAAFGTTDGYNNIFIPQTGLSAGGGVSSGTVVNNIVNISSNTTYYLNVIVDYSAGTPQWIGNITATRIG